MFEAPMSFDNFLEGIFHLEPGEVYDFPRDDAVYFKLVHTVDLTLLNGKNPFEPAPLSEYDEEGEYYEEPEGWQEMFDILLHLLHEYYREDIEDEVTAFLESIKFMYYGETTSRDTPIDYLAELVYY